MKLWILENKDGAITATEGGALVFLSCMAAMLYRATRITQGSMKEGAAFVTEITYWPANG